MPVAIDQGDRKILIIAGIVLVGLTLLSLLVVRPAAERAGYPSSYSPASDGAKGAYLLLQETGYDVQRWSETPEQLPADPNGYVLIVADPLLVASREERDAITRFVHEGGRVVATGATAATLLPEDDSRFDQRRFDWAPYPSIGVSPITTGVHEVTMAPRVRWGTRFPAHVPLVGDADGAVVITYSFGKGTIVWWADSTPLTNTGLRETSDLELFLNSIGGREGTHVLWDEYFHGERAGLWGHLQKTPTPWGLLQLCVVGVAVLLTFARRTGPVRLPLAASRLSPLEFVETVGGLYEKARAGSAAVEIAYKRFRLLLMRQAGVPITAKPKLAWEAVRNRTGVDDQLLETIRDCELALYDQQFAQEKGLELVQRIHHYVEAMRLEPATPQERRPWQER